jgi:hypothetical protein
MNRIMEADPNSEQSRKESELLNLLEGLIRDVKAGRLYGTFGIEFTAQSGKIGHIEELRRRTFK